MCAPGCACSLCAFTRPRLLNVELTDAKRGLGPGQEKHNFSQELRAPGRPSWAAALQASRPQARGGWGGRAPTEGWVAGCSALLEKGQTNGDPTLKAASSSEAVLQLPGNNLDSYSCHHLVHASFLISFGSSRCHSTKGELALRSTLCLT